MISGNVPAHLLAAARTGFLTVVNKPAKPYDRIAKVLDMGAKSVDIVDIGGSPMPLRNRGKTQVQDFIEKAMTVTPLDWDITVPISYNAVADDQTGTLLARCRGAGSNFNKHISQEAYKALNDGDATTNYGAAYDGGAFYQNSHVDAGASYVTAQDNLDALSLSLANLTTVWGKGQVFRDDHGNFTEHNYNLLVVDPSNAAVAWQLTSLQGGTEAITNGNMFSGIVENVVSPQFDTGAWVLVAANEETKPIIIAMREQPNLQSAWFEPDGPDGGTYKFKFYARYSHHYGDWRLALMGKT
jgi:phage major head subunit gpT-like protein